MIDNPTMEAEGLADLLEHPGYKLIIDRIQAEIDTLADKMHDASSKKKEVFFLANWRALRNVQRILIETPANAQTALDEQRNWLDDAEKLGYANPEVAANREKLSVFPSWFGTMETEEELSN